MAVLGALLALLGACAAAEPLSLPPRPAPPVDPAATSPTAEPAGTVRIAYADVPAGWHGAAGDDPAATDLASLWGLPLYRHGPDGHLRPGLVASATVGAPSEGGWAVELRLRRGRWSDGTAVTAHDVVATLEALRAGPRAAELAPLRSVEAIDEATVRLGFDTPYARWPELLSGGHGVLPARVLAEEGLDAYRDAIPVSGGWFRLETFEPGLRARFVAHPDGPLGAPTLAAVEVLFVPRFDTALGLLDDGRADVVLGHLALNPVGRSAEVRGEVRAAAPLGGTQVVLDWDPTVARDVRRTVADGIALDGFVEGLLGAHGAAASSPWPGVEGPAAASAPAGPVGDLMMVAPRWHEAVAFTGRLVEQAVARLGGTLASTTEETPRFAAAAAAADLSLRIRRDPPRPSLTGFVAEASGAVLSADAAAGTSGPAVAAALAEVHEEALVRPLYRAGVAHVWRPTVAGLRASSWPGLALWNVGEWRLQAD